MDDNAIDVQQLHKHFGARPALRGVSLTLRRGEMVALLGASGSGKSTLLRHLAGLHRADAGPPGVRSADAGPPGVRSAEAGPASCIRVLGREVQRGGRLAADVRRTRARIAMIFQQFNLVDRLPVMTNVLAGALHRMPAWRWALGRFTDEEHRRAHDALARVGMAGCAWQRASTLSGGQQQRAAISRALVQGAEVILADEPIASLDPASAQRVMALLAELNRERGTTVLVSLHQVEAAFAFCPRTIALRHGEVVFDGPTAALTRERLRELYDTQLDELMPAGAPPPAPPALAPAGALQAA